MNGLHSPLKSGPPQRQRGPRFLPRERQPQTSHFLPPRCLHWPSRKGKCLPPLAQELPQTRRRSPLQPARHLPRERYPAPPREGFLVCNLPTGPQSTGRLRYRTKNRGFAFLPAGTAVPAGRGAGRIRPNNRTSAGYCIRPSRSRYRLPDRRCGFVHLFPGSRTDENPDRDTVQSF